MHWNSLWDNNSLYVTCKQGRRVHSTQDLDIYIYAHPPPMIHPNDGPSLLQSVWAQVQTIFLCQTNWISSKKQIKHKKQLKEIQKKYMN